MDRTALLDRFRTGSDDVVEALAGITPDELDRRPPDGWTAREIAHHLADSEATAYVRLRRLIGEDNPTIIGYDEEESPGGSTTTARSNRPSPSSPVSVPPASSCSSH